MICANVEKPRQNAAIHRITPLNVYTLYASHILEMCETMETKFF